MRVKEMSGSSKGKLAIICIVIGLALVLGIGLTAAKASGARVFRVERF